MRKETCGDSCRHSRCPSRPLSDRRDFLNDRASEGFRGPFLPRFQDCGDVALRPKITRHPDGSRRVRLYLTGRWGASADWQVSHVSLYFTAQLKIYL